MDYLTYSSMSKELQKEWDYRFKDNNQKVAVTWITYVTLGLLALTIIFMLTCYIVIKEPTLFGDYKMYIIAMMQGNWALLQVSSIIISMLVIVDVIQIVVNISSEYIWLKRNKVKFKLPFFKRLKYTLGF